MKRESVATTIFGSIATIFLVAAMYSLKNLDYISASFYAGITCSGFGIAFYPSVLFEKVKFNGLKMEGHVIFGLPAFLSFLSKIFFMLGILLWVVKFLG